MRRSESGASKRKRAEEEREKIAKLTKLTVSSTAEAASCFGASSSSLSPQPSTSVGTITSAGSDVLGENSNTSSVTHCSVTEKEGAHDNENISKMQICSIMPNSAC